MGVASYDNVKVKEIQDQLPSVEELTKRIRLLEEQLSKEKIENKSLKAHSWPTILEQVLGFFSYICI